MAMMGFTVAVCAVIWLLFAVSLMIRIGARTNDAKAARHHRLINATPSLLTGIGVFGTFTGILLGLLDFDVANIDDSVPLLLEGLKVAFATSVCGLLASLIYRALGSTLALAAGGGDVQATFTAIRKELETQTRALVGEDDASLSSVLGKLRNDLRDGFAEQRRAFDDFARTMAENNSKALIEALEGVIRDFNTKLNEQFGENFKQLNIAVGKLLEWQERYKSYIEDTQAAFEAIQASLSTAAERLSDMVASTETLPVQAQALEAAVLQTRVQIVELTETLGGLASVREKAADAFPTIEAGLERVTTAMTTSAERQGQLMEDAVSRQTEALVRAAQNQRDALTESADTLKARADEALGRVQAAMEENFTRFDEEMQSELTRALELMGGQLASMSGTFADDYRGFSEQIAQLTRAARRAQGTAMHGGVLRGEQGVLENG